MENTYKDLQGNPHVIEGGFEYLLPQGCVLATQADIDAWNTPAPEQLRARLQSEAATALSKTDVSVTRILCKGIAVPADINTYRDALRAIATGKDMISTALPTAPTDYPAGT